VSIQPERHGRGYAEPNCLYAQAARELWVSAAKKAGEINPINHAPVHRLMSLIPNFEPTTERIAAHCCFLGWPFSRIKSTNSLAHECLVNPDQPLRMSHSARQAIVYFAGGQQGGEKAPKSDSG